jgi:hypothetical protein
MSKENQTLRKELKTLNEALDVLVSQIKLEKQRKNTVRVPGTSEDKSVKVKSKMM